MLRFKKSASTEATSSHLSQGISIESEGLIQTGVDTFEAKISSQNGKVSTHFLVVLQIEQSGLVTPSVIKHVESVDC